MEDVIWVIYSISFIAYNALSLDLQAIITVAPSFTISNAVSLPIPVFAPVIITILPLRLGKYLFFPPLKYFFNKIIDVKTLNIFKPRYRY